MQGMRIGDLAARAGCSADALRYYERIGLLPDPARTPNGYREYPEEALQRLLFIRRAQGLGLGLRTIATLLSIADGGACPCHHMQEALLQKIEEISARIAELSAFNDQLKSYAAAYRPGQGDCGCGAALDIGLDSKV